MKKALIVLFIILLTGCSGQGNIEEQLDTIYSDSQSEVSRGFNNYSHYIDYYRPSDLLEQDCDELSFEFTLNNSSIIMNVNVAGIVSDEYYSGNILNEGFFDEDKIIYSKTGVYQNADQMNFDYSYGVYEYEGKYLLYFYSKELIIYGYCESCDMVDASYKILNLAKDSSVSEDTVLEDYSSKDIVDYQRKQIDLFETTLPVNGRVEDLIVSSD